MSPTLDAQIWSLKWLRIRLTCLPFYNVINKSVVDCNAVCRIIFIYICIKIHIFVIFLSMAYPLSSAFTSFRWHRKEKQDPLNHWLNQWRWLDQWTGTHWVNTSNLHLMWPTATQSVLTSHLSLQFFFPGTRGGRLRLNGLQWKYDFRYALLTHRGEAFAKFYQSVQLCIKWLSKGQPSFFMP